MNGGARPGDPTRAQRSASLGCGVLAAVLFQVALDSPQGAAAALANGLSLAWFRARVSTAERVVSPFLIGTLALLSFRWIAGGGR